MYPASLAASGQAAQPDCASQNGASFLDQVGQEGSHGSLAILIAKKVVANFDHDVWQAVGEAMFDKSVGDAVCGAIWFVAADNVICLHPIGPRDHRVSQPTIAIMENSDLHISSLAEIHGSETMHRNQHGRPAGRSPSLD
jgi:hypothetical protein